MHSVLQRPCETLKIGMRAASSGKLSRGPILVRARGAGRPWLFAAVGLVLCCLALSPVPASAESVSAGLAAYREGDYRGARDIWRSLAEAGGAVAQFNLGKLYENGGGEVRQDYSQAVRWYREAAAQGMTAAQNNLAVMHCHGLGVPRNPRRAAELWERAAGEDYSLAQYNLALVYFGGECMARNERLAAVWFEKAAQAGLPDAQYAMGQLLRLGRVSARDEGQALAWYKLAAAQGHAHAAQQAESLQARGVVAKDPVPFEPAASVEAATSEPTSEQPAMLQAPSADPALDVQADGERDRTDAEKTTEVGVAAVVPIPVATPHPPAVAAAPQSGTASQ